MIAFAASAVGARLNHRVCKASRPVDRRRSSCRGTLQISRVCKHHDVMGILEKLRPQPRWKHADPGVRAAAVYELGPDEGEALRLARA